jgi:DNA-binding transcriptional LysR family regulator
VQTDLRQNTPRVSGGSADPSLLIQQIELRHLRYVVAVAEDLHFNRAANRLHLAAPSLSKQIRQLETLLGYPLFERRTRQVVLTKAGSAFVVEARDALNHVALALNLSATANGAETRGVALGYSPWTDLLWIVEAKNMLLREVGTDITLRSEHTASQVEDLLAGRLGGGIVILPVKASGLEAQVLRREHLVLALPESHALAESAMIAFKALGGEPLISMAGSLEPALNDHLRRIGEESGFVPNVVYEVTSLSEALELVASKVGIALVRASSAVRLPARGVVFRECAEPELFVEVGLAYRIQHPPPGVQNLIKFFRHVVNENT